MSERYHPCRTGLHVCGADHDANEFFTQANHPPAPSAARAVFQQARDELGQPEGQLFDFVVDLMIDGDIADDFTISRQMLARLAAMATPPVRSAERAKGGG